MRADKSLLSLLALAIVAVVAAATLGSANGQDSSFVMTFKDNKLEPAVLEVPAGVEFKLIVKNADTSAEEFESESLELEKVIPGGTEAEFKIGPLDPGSYDVFGEFHEDTATGKIVVK